MFFGAWVEIENDDGDTLRFRIVGYDEIFGRKDYISIDSPMARALLKKEVGDLAVVQTPGGEATGTSTKLRTLNSPRAPSAAGILPCQPV